MAEPVTILEETIPACAGWSGKVMHGETLILTDLKGAQAVDALFYNLHMPQERYHAPNTMKAAGTTHLTTGHVLYSDEANPLVSVIADDFGGHDTIGGCCSIPSNRMLYGTPNTGCRENFLEQLGKHGLGRRDIVPNVNFFMQVPIGTDGAAEIAHGASKPGTTVTLRAEMDVLVVLSNCPQVLNPCNAFDPTPVKVTVLEAP